MKVLRVHDSDAILEKMRLSADQLPTGASVQIMLDDGHSWRGIVRARPTLSVGEDLAGKKGEYAVLTLQEQQWIPGMFRQSMRHYRFC
jgi:hypothetical protein